MKRYIDILKKRLDMCEDIKARIENFINSIPDPLTKEIFKLRYYQELTWQRIALLIGRHDESYPRKRHNRYLDSTSDSDLLGTHATTSECDNTNV